MPIIYAQSIDILNEYLKFIFSGMAPVVKVEKILMPPSINYIKFY